MPEQKAYINDKVWEHINGKANGLLSDYNYAHNEVAILQQEYFRDIPFKGANVCKLSCTDTISIYDLTK